MRSWVPECEITGLVVRHGESFTMSDHLTVWDGEKAIYRPTVHYAYCPADVAINSMRELEMRQWNLQKKQRIMNEEIIDGEDRLGVLLMGHPYKSWSASNKDRSSGCSVPTVPERPPHCGC